jgi:hypothetical protein
MLLMNSAFWWLLIRPVLTYGLIAMNFEVRIQCWTDSRQTGILGFVRFLGHEMGETCWVRNTRSEAHLLSFSTPTQTHVSDVHSHGYGHFSTATCGVSSLWKNWIIERVGAFGTVTDSSKIMTF